MKIIDLSPAVPHGFKGPPSTDLGVQMNVRTKNGTGYWQSTQLDLMSLHTGTHVESALHTVEGGEAIDEVALEKANERLEATGESLRSGHILLLRTDWAQRHIGTQKYFRESPGLTAEAARWIVERRPKSVGCDFFEEPAARLDGGRVRRAWRDPGRGHPAD